MIESSSSVLPSQQKTYSKAERSSCCMRTDTPWENGVSTTIGICGNCAFIPRAMSKTSFDSVEGIQMMRSNGCCATCVTASSRDAARKKRGGYLSPSFVYSSKSFSSMRPSSSSMKAS